MEGVLLGQVSHLCEPGMFQAMVEHVGAMLPKDVGGAKQCNHEEEAKLSHMEDGWCRECARQEIDCRGGCAGVQALESLQCRITKERHYVEKPREIVYPY